MEEKKHFDLDKLREEQAKKNEIKSTVISTRKLKLSQYRAVFIPQKGLVSQDNHLILWYKDLVVISKQTKISQPAYEAVAKEQGGRVIRGDKAVHHLLKVSLAKTGTIPTTRPVAYVLGEIVLKGRF